MGDFTDENDGIIQESRFLKVQIVDGGRRDPALGMAGRHDSCQLVDPHEQLATEKPAITVNVPVHQKIRLLCHRILNSFFLIQNDHPGLFVVSEDHAVFAKGTEIHIDHAIKQVILIVFVIIIKIVVIKVSVLIFIGT